MKSVNLSDVKQSLNKRAEINAYKLYNDVDIDDLAREIEAILSDEVEVQRMRTDQYYLKNIYDLILFIYNKTLSETKETMSTKKAHRRQVFSEKSLDILYGITG